MLTIRPNSEGIWESPTPMEVDESVLSSLSVSQYVLQYVDKYWDNVALLEFATGTTFTFREMVSAMESVSSGLWKAGLRTSDVVSVVAPSCAQYPILQHAIVSTGAAATFAKPQFTTYELEYHYKDCSPKFVFTTNDLLSKVTEALNRAGFQCDIYLLDGDEESSNPSGYGGAVKSYQVLLEDDGSCNCLWRKDLIQNPKSHVCFLPYSSGTTGLPKGVMASHFSTVWQIASYNAAFPLRAGEDVTIAQLPVFHVTGYLISGHAFLNGCRLIVMPDFAPHTFIKAIADHKVSAMFLVPHLIRCLSHHPDVEKYNMSHIRKVLTAADYFSAQDEKDFIARFPHVDIQPAHGQTEVSFGMFSPPREQRCPGKDGSVGFPAPGVVAQLRSLIDGTVVTESNTRGELVMRSSAVMIGYHNNPESTKYAFTEDGWLKSGDVMYFDADGYFYMVDRMKDMIKTLSMQVAPTEIEHVILQLPQVKDVAVIGVADIEKGQVAMACVVLQEGQQITEEEVKAFVAERLAPFKHLHGGVRFLESLPRTPTGKLMRAKLRDALDSEMKLF